MKMQWKSHSVSHISGTAYMCAKKETWNFYWKKKKSNYDRTRSSQSGGGYIAN